MPFESVGLQSWARQSGLALHHLQILFISVICINGAGLESSASSSPILIHTMGPTFSVPACIEARGSACSIGSTNTFANESNHLELRWRVDKRKEMNTKQFWAIGLTKGGQEIQNFSRIDQDYVLLPPSMKPGRYFFSVLVEDELQRTAFSESPSLFIDQSPPDGSLVVIDPKPGSCLSHCGVLTVRWKGFMDGESGISHFMVSVGVFPGDDSMCAAKEYDNSTNQVLLSILPADLFPATTVFISVGCVNRAGLMTSVFTEIKVDSTPPIPGQVLDVDPRSGALAIDIDTHHHSRLKAVWDPFLDN
jgi:hypothetical protein